MQNSLQQQPAVMLPHTCSGMSWSYPEGADFKKVQVNLFQGNLKDMPIKTRPSYQLHAFYHCILKSLFPLTLWRPSKKHEKASSCLGVRMMMIHELPLNTSQKLKRLLYWISKGTTNTLSSAETQSLSNLWLLFSVNWQLLFHRK